MSRGASCFVGLLASLFCVPQQTLAAAPATWSLRWESPPDCPDETFVRSEIESLVASPGSPGLRRVVARGLVWRGELGQWQARIETDAEGVAGERRVEGSTCREVTEAAILIVALAIDPTSSDKRQSAAPAAVEQSPATSQAVDARALVPITPPQDAPPRADAKPQARVRDDRGARAWLEAGPVVAFGVLPGSAQGVSGGLGVVVDGWRLRFAAAWWPAKHGEVEGEPNKGGDIGLASVEAAVSQAWQLEEIAVGPEVGLIGGVLRGEGTGVRNPAVGVARWAAAAVGGRVTWSLGNPVALEARARLLLPVYRQRFQLDDIGIVHEPAAIAGMGGLFLAAHF